MVDFVTVDFVKLCEAFRKKITGKGTHFDTSRYYEVDRLGPIFLAWKLSVARNNKGKVTKQKYKIKHEKNHLIWVKWKRPFPGTKTYWSAEPQANFPDNMKGKVQNKLDKKEIWPYPSRLGGDDKWQERDEECQKLGNNRLMPDIISAIFTMINI